MAVKLNVTLHKKNLCYEKYTAKEDYVSLQLTATIGIKISIVEQDVHVITSLYDRNPSSPSCGH